MKFEVSLEREGDSEMFEDLARYLKFHPNLARFLFNPAGVTFLFGWLLFMGMCLGWLAISLLDPDAALRIAATLATEIFPGKEAAVFLGIVGLGLHPLIVFGVVVVQDLITTMWVYPVFYLFRKNQTGRQNFFGYFFAKMERRAKRHQAFIEKWGGWGIFLFMLVPFAVNGPLIGAIIGKLAGVRTRYILPAVVGSTAVSTGYWTLLWHFFRPQTEAFVDKYGGPWIALGVVGVFTLFILKEVIDFVRDVRHFREIQARRREIMARERHEQTLILGDPVDVESRRETVDD
ncbi:MAG TPA: small multi-drug export protein [Candidatus Thermoplasmatota archaeon]|nr:small multi-drug export protein [Candidatus Thermoplasmatota archaeon]